MPQVLESTFFKYFLRPRDPQCGSSNLASGFHKDSVTARDSWMAKEVCDLGQGRFPLWICGNATTTQRCLVGALKNRQEISREVRRRSHCKEKDTTLWKPTVTRASVTMNLIMPFKILTCNVGLALNRQTNLLPAVCPLCSFPSELV